MGAPTAFKGCFSPTAFKGCYLLAGCVIEPVSDVAERVRVALVLGLVASGEFFETQVKGVGFVAFSVVGKLVLLELPGQ